MAEQPDDDLVTAWFQHAAAVESKLDRMAGSFAAMVEQVTKQGDPASYPDPFAHVALDAAVTWSKSTDGGTVDDLASLADRLEAWLRRPRGDG
jgi:hypothetical protein